MKKIVPTTHAVTANEPNSHANVGSMLTAVSEKLSADESATWNCEKAMTTDFMRTGALVNAYSSDVIEAKISEMPTRMYGPETTQTLTFAGFCVPSSFRHSEGLRSWQGDFS